MKSIDHRAVRGAALAAFVIALLVPAAWAATAPSITLHSIAGAKLGLDVNVYKKLLGKPVRYEAAKGGDLSLPGFQQPEGWYRLISPRRKTEVFFAANGQPGEIVTTWNKSYRSADGVGPCSSFEKLKAAYGSRLKPNPGNTDPTGGTVYSYIVGRSLIFELSDPKKPGRHVTSVGLYDGSGAGWNKPGGPLYFASFIASQPDTPACKT